MKNIFISLFIGLASGHVCAQEVTQVSDNLYSVKSDSEKSHSNRTEAKMNAIDRAADYCKELGKRVLIKQVKGSDINGPTPNEAEATFRCISEGEKFW